MVLPLNVIETFLFANPFPFMSTKVNLKLYPDLTLVNKIKKFNLGGIEELSGIPSSVGGALVNNAEAHNVSLYDYLIKVLVYKDKLYYLNKEEINYSYRYSSLKNNFIVLFLYYRKIYLLTLLLYKFLHQL